MSAAEWRYVLEQRELCMKGLDNTELESVMAREIMKNSSERRARSEAHVIIRALRSNVRKAPPVLMTREVYDRLRTNMLVSNYVSDIFSDTGSSRIPSTMDGSLTINSLDAVATLYRSDILSARCPLSGEIDSGLLILPVTVTVVTDDGAMAGIRAIYFTHSGILDTNILMENMAVEEDSPGLQVVVFFDPKYTTALVGKTRDRYYLTKFARWIPTDSFQVAAMKVQQNYHRNNYEHPEMDNQLMWSLAHALLLSFDRYLQTRVGVVETSQPDVTLVKKVRKLNAPSTLKVVHWRREDARTSDPDSQAKHIDWSHQWDVRPHVRTYKRGTPEEYTVNISQYRKGPKNKPYIPKDILHIADR